MLWLPAKEAVKALGITENQFWGHVRRGRVERKLFEDGFYRYAVPSKEGSPPSQSEKVEFFIETPNYLYDDRREVYIFNNLPGQKGSVTVPKSRIDDLIWDYSNDTGGLSINEICRKYALTRPTVRSILSNLGITHDSPPFSEQKIEATPEEDLIESLVRAKEQKVIVKAQRERFKSIQKKAELLEKFDQILFDNLVSKIQSVPPTVSINIDPENIPNQQPHVTVVGLTDLHVGKVTIEEDSRMAVMQERALKTTITAIERSLALWGVPDRWVIPCGSDLLHIDNYFKTTTSGTPQDSADPLDILVEAYGIMQQIVDALSEYAPVTVIGISGNHDRVLSLSVGLMLKARYHQNPKVEVDLSQSDYAYFRYENSLLGFHHGDGVKKEELSRIMSRDRAKDWSDCEGGWEWFTGHLHHFNSKEYYGCRVWTMPALCGTDRWHKHKGYTGSKRQLALYRVAPRGGVQGVELVDLCEL